MNTTANLELGREKNVRKPTGPRTPKGKRRSSQNAAKHGILSKKLSLSPDLKKLPTECRKLYKSLASSLQPQTPEEEMLVEIIATTFFRWRAVCKLHTDLLEACQLDTAQEKNLYRENLDRTTDPLSDIFPDRRLELFEENAEKLQRYEAHLWRILSRSLNELERLQRMRRGDRVPAPVVVDIQK
jgi:hypothetical protein